LSDGAGGAACTTDSRQLFRESNVIAVVISTTANSRTFHERFIFFSSPMAPGSTRSRAER